MDDYDTKAEDFKVVLILESLVNRHQNIKLALKPFSKLVILKIAPTHLNCCFHFVTGKTFGHSRINTGVYEDAHVSCSRVMSWLSVPIGDGGNPSPSGEARLV